jgi:hypothetical protein
MPSPPIAAQHRTAANPDRLVRLAIAVTLTQAFADSDSAFVRAIDIAAKTLDQHFAEGGT